MNSTAARNTRIGLLAGRSPLLRLQSDERLIALIRSGHEGAFALLFERYRPRLLSFCRHMLASKEDAEDVLQEVFAASYNAIRADNRPLNVRPWLYRIARNRCLNHLRRPTQDGRDTMDDQTDLNGASTADLVHSRAEFRHLLQDIQTLPETQRTALLLREIDVLSYEQIADTMETTVPSVKSLLVRARMSLAEAAEARQLTCNEVRRELAEVTEGLKKTTAPLRRHVRQCDQCKRYRKQLNKTTTAMAITLPLGPLLVLKKLFLAKAGAAAAAGGGGAATGGATGAAAAGGSAAAASGLAAGGASTAVPLGLSAVAAKAITVTTVTALVAGGAVEVNKFVGPHPQRSPRPLVQSAYPPKAVNPVQGAAALAPASLPSKNSKKAAKSAPPTDKKAKDATKTQGPPAESTDQSQTVPAGASGPVGPLEAQQTPAPGATPAPADSQETGGASLPAAGATTPPPGHADGQVQAKTGTTN
jgi:RNA polymerase sigma factor (sigma-70 family)